MSDTPVLVRQLRLHGGRAAPAHAVRARVEDALRISSKPPALTHAYVLLRRLRLRMPASASAQSVALQLEAQWRALASLARPIATAPDEAQAVWAADEVQARLALLQRWLDAVPATAWFWRRLLPEVPAAWPLPQRVQALLCTPLSGTSAATGEAAAQQSADQVRLWLLAAPRLQAVGQWAVWEAASAQAPAAVQQAVRQDGLDVAGAAPARGVIEDEVRHAAMVPLRASASPLAQDVAQETTKAAPRRPSWVGVDCEEVLRPTALPSPASLPPIAHPQPRAVAEATAAAAQRVGALPPQQPAPTDLPLSPAAPSPEPTDWAGLWFLLPMLRIAQLDRAADAAPALALLLQQLARRHCFDPPVQRWIDVLAERYRANEAPLALHATTAAWQRVLRLQALQATRLPLRRVLHRPGRLLLAPHRVDVLLPLAQADIRLRRAGFDIDPGYLPWLDTIVHFHYL